MAKRRRSKATDLSKMDESKSPAAVDRTKETPGSAAPLESRASPVSIEPGPSTDEVVVRARTEIDLHRQRFWRFVTNLLAFSHRATIWLGLLLVLWLLRDFFALIFVTFVFCFVSASGARILGRFFPELGWRSRVTCVFAAFLAVWSVFGWLLVPRIREGYAEVRATIRDFPSRWATLEDRLIAEHAWYRELLLWLDPEASSAIEPLPESEGDREDAARDSSLSSSNEEGIAQTDIAGSFRPIGDPADGVTSSPPPGDESASSIGAAPAVPRRLAELPIAQRTLAGLRESLVEHTPGLIGSTLTAIAALSSLLFLATLFSYLIVLDIDGLRREVRKLEATKLSDFYRETATSIARFGEVLGRVLEAQAVIAFVNAILTAVGLWLFGVEPVLFLSLIVFVCGFIPVAGVFLSSVPICLVGLYQGGIGLLLLLIAFIILIHFIEAYFLNPRIMGAALKVNPVLTLIILVIGHHAFGVWGMLLGLPLCYWFFTHVVRKEAREIGLWAPYRREKAA